MGLKGRQGLWADTQGLPLGSQGVHGLRLPWRFHQVLAQHAGSRPAACSWVSFQRLLALLPHPRSSPYEGEKGQGKGVSFLNTQYDT